MASPPETATDQIPSSHARDIDSTDHPISFVERQISTLAQEMSDCSEPVVVLPVGKSGAGKTTLINTFFELTGYKAFRASMGASPVTKAVDYCDKDVKGVKVRLIDMPGLHDSAPDARQRVAVPRNIMASLKVVTGKGLDVVFFCISLTNRHENINWKIIDTLTTLFGKQVWSHVIFIFTFADFVEYQGKDALKLAEGYIPDLTTYLRKKGVNQEIRLIHSPPEEADILCSFKGIPGIVVSDKPTIPKDWKDLLFLLVLNKCKNENIPAVLKMWRMYFNWYETKKTLKIVSKCGGLGAGIATTGAAAIGAVVGGLTTIPIGGVGALAGAAAGATIVGLIGTIGGFGSVAGTALGIRAAYIFVSRRGIINAERNKLEIRRMSEAESAASEQATVV